jgi:hypothetical protein
MFKLFKTYNKAKDVFVRPKVKVSFGLWKRIGIPPAYVPSYRIKIAKSNQYYFPQNSVSIVENKTNTSKHDITIPKYKTYKTSYHKLPKNAIRGVWNRNIRKKLRKLKLGWIKPYYTLPSWFSFHIFDYDLTYKWKYDDIRYEYPPQFTIVFLGLALSFTLKPILEDEYDSDDFYFESLLCYLYQPECNKNITDTLIYCGKWTHFKQNGEEEEFFQLRKTHIKDKYHEEYNEAIKKYKKNKENDNT